jgi:hypothetical protein
MCHGTGILPEKNNRPVFVDERIGEQPGIETNRKSRAVQMARKIDPETLEDPVRKIDN